MIGLIMGPAGSGKGTQAELICQEYNLKQLSTGDVFREESKKNTEQGKMIKNLIDGGNLVPDDITMKITHDFINLYKNVLLDGTPRNVYQAKYLYEHTGVDFVLLLEVGEKEVIRRMGERRICTATKKIYIADKITQKDIEECEAAGGKIVARKDDSDIEAIKKRLNIYHNLTEPIIDFYEQNKVKVLHINGEQSIDAVYKDIKKELDKIFN